jgi:hypothetical protein
MKKTSLILAPLFALTSLLLPPAFSQSTLQTFDDEAAFLAATGAAGNGLYAVLGLLLVDSAAGRGMSSAERLARSALAAHETPVEAALRHDRVAQRRSGVEIICHRGAQEFAYENTLDAYRAALELGADGNKIDIRATRDGELVCFHDDMLDRLLEAYGTVREVDWSELRSFRSREPSRFGAPYRIPTLVEALELHRKHAGLVDLDLKEPGLDTAVAELLDRLDMWDHVSNCNPENAAAIIQNPKFRPSRYKAGLYEDRSDADPAAIAAALEQPGNAVSVEDPRWVLVALARPLGRVSKSEKRADSSPQSPAATEDSIVALVDADDWNCVAESTEEQTVAGERIRARARAADLMLAAGTASDEAFATLEERVRHRSLHHQWMFHGLDGAMALRALVRLRAPQAVAVSRDVLWLDDPDLERVPHPEWHVPRSWTDYRVKMHVFPSLATFPGPATEQLCREYLDLGDEAARVIGPPQFEEAARTLLAVSPITATALELMRHSRRAVRGRAILDCLFRAAEPWARAALEVGAPWAVAWIVPD